MYEYWFRRFKSDDFDLKDKERSGQPKKKDAELHALLDENSAWTLEKLVKALNVLVNQAFLIVYMQWERFKKKTNEFHMNRLNWLIV